jgi:hypothetical protein
MCLVEGKDGNFELKDEKLLIATTFADSDKVDIVK